MRQLPDNRHRPLASQLALERVKSKARNGHVSNLHRLVQAGQYAFDFVNVS